MIDILATGFNPWVTRLEIEPKSHRDGLCILNTMKSSVPMGLGFSAGKYQ